jgi:3-oxoacyl-[acyl-carrier protein] reductase
MSDAPARTRALVTGGSGDIGAAICRRLAAEHDVVVHANGRLERAEEIAAAIVAGGGRASAIAFDVCDADASAAAIATLLEAGPIQVVVNNAGIHDDAVFPGMRADQWSRVVDVSLNGFFHVTQPLTMPMIRTRWGRIVNVSSLAALAGNRGQVNYAAAKAALHGATKSLALELASRGITVNAVAPGIIAGSMSDGAFDDKTIAAMVPMKRAGRPEEVAELVGFLASDRAGYITGQIISINGGIPA